MKNFDKIWNEVLKDPKLKEEYVQTYLGTSITLSEFIIRHADFLEIDNDTNYCVALSIHAYFSLIHDMSDYPDYENLAYKELPIQEKLIKVVKYLYESCKKRGLIE